MSNNQQDDLSSNTNELVLVDGGINWTWYMHLVETRPGHVQITRYYRLHDERDRHLHPRKTDGYVDTIIEDGTKNAEGWPDRTVRRVRYAKHREAPVEAIVDNQQYIFSYN